MLAGYNSHTSTVELLLGTGKGDVDAISNHHFTNILALQSATEAS